ncbi:recombinase family protein [Pseudobacteroides cellulosolvens]|uniref:Recombinase n=1 Tax=Pseudobacteroides cellulosolvens ATCC 35603 = DSM 2933 TaxID=398512 RepID=A0A0L6JHD7_9FIRM|nr:recombinase family protein [Pseudobacteroides cellulosolvens]KNY24887.1 Recombinase [Pseudobacteroides cellulosolvens ATCC 35603 = DSM 2933]
MNRVCIYLRKSRADEELEKELGEGETLSKHRKALLKFANDKNLNIVKIREEIVSGESLIHRPQMLQLLKEVGQSDYEAVLVMDMERLGRGNMQEQGLILDTFKKSKTKIITLRKTYDLTNDFDEEYSEFEAFMSRKEFKMINRRLQGGRVRSAEEGNYLGTYPPYGYLIHEEKHTRTLLPNPHQAEAVKLIFDLYVNDNIGTTRIAEELTKLGYNTYTGVRWDRSVISSILKNPVYVGKIVWKKKCIRKSASPDKSKETYTRPQNEWIISQGKHPALVSEDIFNAAQNILKGKYHAPYHVTSGLSNPLASLVICKQCGSKMKMRPYGNKATHIACTKKCGCKSSKLKYLEESLLKSMDEYFKKYELLPKENTSYVSDRLNILKKNLIALESQLTALHKQKAKIHDLFEQGIYNFETFTSRLESLAKSLDELNQNISYVTSKAQEEEKNISIQQSPTKLNHLLDIYRNTDDIPSKNKLLKNIIEKVEYIKSKEQRNDNFTLIVYPKLP